MKRSALPIIFLAFANNRVEPGRFLRNLPQEEREIRDALAQSQKAGHCELVIRSNATLREILDVFQDEHHRNRIAIFHFSGHANDSKLILESTAGGPSSAHARGLAAFLGEQRGLELVFLNGCSTAKQAQALVDVGISAVIGTSRAVRDLAAMALAARFYRALGSGASLSSAYKQAEGAVESELRDPSAAYQGFGSEEREVDVSRRNDDGRPWHMVSRPGAGEHVARWSLPRLAGDPTFGLPTPIAPKLKRPPFKYLEPFSHQDSAVFFGRGREIRDLFNALTVHDSAPIVLLCGTTGVGKSSLLDAGLCPRLERVRSIVYRRRNPDVGLSGDLVAALECAESETPADAWQRREAGGIPLVLILDQVEEAYTLGWADDRDEVRLLAEDLRQIFVGRTSQPTGRILLSFREEWLAEIETRLEEARLWYRVVRVEHLSHDGIVAAITGLESSDRLKEQYHLEVDPELPELIANDLLRDRGEEATIAPALQVLLSKMWERQPRARSKRFTVALYEDFRSRIRLGDFVDEQIEELKSWKPELVASGLLLDLLHHHTTAGNTAAVHSARVVLDRYRGQSVVAELLQRLKNRYLLSGSVRIRDGQLIANPDDPEDFGTTRLAHDTLAPIIRRRFEESDRPGQRAARILEQRAKDWKNGKEGAPLDSVDLAIVEEGELGMRRWESHEEALVDASRRRRSFRRTVTGLAALVITVSVIIALLKTQEAIDSEQRALDRMRVANAGNLLANDRAIWGGLVLLEVSSLPLPISQEALVHEALAASPEFPTNLQDHMDTAIKQVTAVSPAEDIIATASTVDEVKLWDLDNGRLLRELKWDKSRDRGFVDYQLMARSISFSADGSRLMVSSVTKAHIWDVEEGTRITTLEYEFSDIISFSSSGGLVLTDYTFSTQIWDATDGTVDKVLESQVCRFMNQGAIFSPDSSKIAKSCDDRIYIWDVRSGQQLAVIDTGEDIVWTATFDPSGDRIATSSTDGTIRVWDIATSSLLNMLRDPHHEGSAIRNHYWTVSVRFTSDGMSLLISCERGGYKWSLESDSELMRFATTLNRGSARVTASAFDIGGDYFATTSEEGMSVWDTRTGVKVNEFRGRFGTVSSLEFGPGGTYIVTRDGGDGEVRIWDTRHGAELARTEARGGLFWTSFFSPDGQEIAMYCSNGDVYLWSPKTDESEVLAGHREGSGFAGSFHPSLELVASASNDGTARLWSTVSGKAVQVFKHPRQVNHAVFSPDGRRLLTASGQAAYLWDIDTGGKILSMLDERIDDRYSMLVAVFNPNGDRVVTGSSDGAISIWDSSSGKKVADLPRRAGEIVSLSFDPAGKRIVAGSFDRTAAVYDIFTSTEILTLNHPGPVLSALFDRSGDRLVSSATDHKLRYWDARTGTEIGSTKGSAGASVSPDNKLVVSTLGDGTARLWAFDMEILLGLIRARTRRCLPFEFRVQTLDETSEQARQNVSACEVCTEKFFDQLGDTPRSQWEVYVEAWRDYRDCFGSRSSG